MKKIISVFLVAAFLCIMMPGTYAAGSNETFAGFHYADGLYWQETEEMVLTIYPNKSGEYCASYVFKNDTYTVYEVNTGIMADNGIVSQSDLNAIKAKALEKKSVAKAVSTRAPAGYAAKAGDQLKINAVKQKMANRYGSAYSWKDLYTETEYLPTIVKIREDKIHSAEQVGIRTLQRTLSAASAAAALAGWLGITVSAALDFINSVIGFVLDAGEALGITIFAEAYRGVTMWTRTGTVIPQGGSETPVTTATRSYLRQFLIDYELSGTSSDYYDYLADTGYFEEVYIPNAYYFDYSYLADLTYDIYAG